MDEMEVKLCGTVVLKGSRVRAGVSHKGGVGSVDVLITPLMWWQWKIAQVPPGSTQ